MNNAKPAKRIRTYRIEYNIGDGNYAQPLRKEIKAVSPAQAKTEFLHNMAESGRGEMVEILTVWRLEGIGSTKVTRTNTVKFI